MTILSCKKETYGLNTEFELDFNETAIVNVGEEKWTVKYTELTEESRCPPEAYCIWAGQVAVRIEINDHIQAVIGHHTEIPPSFEFKQSQIRLRGVEYNKDRNFGKEKHSNIRLIVD
ncbi:hypothetical protein DXU93_07095 [Brumimicrobium aurantiacum]|uniref:Uncharacterized protein n=2 Tax=Brumimicrobium aurantiacum TaxID=1737063 RepID=A0A3E1EYW1_9FLAO|nr:hypothetical protein DXU93_07095 [Brumimicrobium aurantiacum]